MRKLHEKREALFAVLWIVAYCAAMTPIKGAFGYGSVRMLPAIDVTAMGIPAFVKTNRPEKRTGLAFGPIQLIGGLNKRRPNEEDVGRALRFHVGLNERRSEP